MDVVVIGGGYAGVACALRLARRGGPAVRVTLVNGSERFVERIRLHQAAAGQALPTRELRPLLERAGVRLVVGWASGINVARRTVQVGVDKLPWDRLVLAIGSRQARLDAQAAAVARVLEPSQVDALAQQLHGLPAGGRVLVVGGGLTGVEAATEIAESHPRLQVTLASRGPVLADWSESARAHVHAAFQRLGIRCHEGSGVHTLQAGRAITDGETVAFDVCVWTAGFSLPALPAGLVAATTATGQLQVDASLRLPSHPHIHVAGDMASPAQAAGVAADPMPMGCKSALPSGAHVGNTIASEALQARAPAAQGAGAGEASAREPQPFAYGLPFYCLSLGRRDGVIQWPDATGGLRNGKVLRGAEAAVFKEEVCAWTWDCLVDESTGREAIRAPTPRKPPPRQGASSGGHESAATAR